jgi:hypothetical protein
MKFGLHTCHYSTFLAKLVSSQFINFHHVNLFFSLFG